MNIAEETGSKIRHYRKIKQMTVEQLAAAIRKSKSCVSKYESGQIIIDVVTLYEVAQALDVKVTQLLHLPLSPHPGAPSGSVPSFFVGLSHLYMYYYDGRKNRLTRCVVDIFSEVEPGVYQVQMYMNVDDYSHYQQCENLYDGVLTHYDALSTLIMKNQSMEMDNYQVGIPSPYMNAPTKWALAFGISSRPLMPTSTKVLLSKTVQKETPEFEKELRLSKEDIRLMKQYDMLTVL